MTSWILSFDFSLFIRNYLELTDYSLVTGKGTILANFPDFDRNILSRFRTFSWYASLARGDSNYGFKFLFVFDFIKMFFLGTETNFLPKNRSYTEFEFLKGDFHLLELHV